MCIVYKAEKLIAIDLFKHLQDSKSDFPRSSLIDKAYELSEKWALYADVITAKNENGDLLGLIVYYANRLPQVFTTHVWVDVSVRGRGICGKMLKFQERICALKGFTEHHLEVACNNISAIKAYKKFGFDEVELLGSSIILGKHIDEEYH